LSLKLHIKGWIIPPLFIYCLLQSSIIYAGSLTPFFKTDIFAYSEPIAVKAALFDDGKGRYSKGKRQFAWSWLELGFLWQQKVGFSFLRRYDYDLRFSKDTAKLYGMTVNKQDLPVGREFFVDLKTDIFHAKGLRISYNSFLFDRLKITTGLSYLQTGYFINGDLHGRATVLAENDYDYVADVDYQYTKDELFDRSVNDINGHGFSLDIDAYLDITPAWSAQFKITDLLSWIYWKNLPQTVAITTSDRKKFDSDGYIHINPTLTGREGEHSNYTQILSPRSMLNIKYSYFHYTAFIEGYYQYDFLLWNTGCSIKTGVGNALIKYWPKNEAVTIGYKYQKFEIEITADHFEIDKVKMFQLFIAYEF